MTRLAVWWIAEPPQSAKPWLAASYPTTLGVGTLDGLRSTTSKLISSLAPSADAIALS
jgi:hypothetical protein